MQWTEESILNPEQQSNSDSAECDVADDEEDDLGAGPEEPERDEATVAGQIMKLHQEIFSWGMIAGPWFPQHGVFFSWNGFF